MTEQNETKTSRLLFWFRAAFVAYFIFSVYALLSPRPTFGKVEIPTFSLLHAAAFSVLGALAELARGKFPAVAAYTLLLIYGPLTEIIQPITGRCFQWVDILEDTVGIIAGVAAAWLLKSYLARREAKRQTDGETACSAEREPK